LELFLELPVSQGFGMSAAGLLATSLALGELFDVGEVGQLARLAHRIERNHSTGLGDILGLWAGGVELREVPGSPPSPGKVRAFSANVPALLIWVPSDTKHTSGYIDNLEWKIAITKAGDKSVNHLMKYPWNRKIWPELLSEADRFAIDSGLLEEKERSDLLATVVENIENNMSCHLCMLGTSVIIVPSKIDQKIDCDEVASKLRSLGLGVFETRLQ
jgi:pantoate kinase